MPTSELDVGMKCIKYMLFISNFMFVMIGFLLISVGSTVGSINGDFAIFMESHHFSPAALVVAIGVIIFMVAIIGCVGAVKESTCLVNMYALCLAMILILELSASIAAYVMRNDLKGKLEINMNNTIKQYNEDDYVRDSWDFLQYRLQCCGIHNYTDWEGIYNSTGGTLPALPTSLTSPNIVNVPETCYNRFSNALEINAIGCLDRLTFIVSESALLLGSGALCVAFVQFLGIIFAHMLAKAIRRVKTETERTRQENRLRLYEQLARGQEEKQVTPVLYTTERQPL